MANQFVRPQWQDEVDDYNWECELAEARKAEQDDHEVLLEKLFGSTAYDTMSRRPGSKRKVFRELPGGRFKRITNRLTRQDNKFWKAERDERKRPLMRPLKHRSREPKARPTIMIELDELSEPVNDEEPSEFDKHLTTLETNVYFKGGIYSKLPMRHRPKIREHCEKLFKRYLTNAAAFVMGESNAGRAPDEEFMHKIEFQAGINETLAHKFRCEVICKIERCIREHDLDQLNVPYVLYKQLLVAIEQFVMPQALRREE